MNDYRCEATVTPPAGRFGRWHIELQEWADFGHGLRPDPCVTEKAGWNAWTEKGAERIAARLVRRRYEEQRVRRERKTVRLP